MPIRFYRGAAALLFTAAAAPGALAVPAGPVPQPAEAPLEEIIVVGQRDAPISIEPRGLSVSLGEAQFAAVNAVNVEDLMKYAPNFFVRKRYIGDANAVPGFRGTHSTQSARSLVLVDGFVVSNLLGNSFSFPPKWGVVGPGEVRQFDIVYGPYSPRFPGSSMGGVVSITTRAPEATEAFATLQGFAQPYRQYGTRDTYLGYTAEAGVGWKPEGAPWSARVSARRLENEGQPMQWRQLVPAASGAGAVPVTGGFSDPDLIAPGPVFAADAPDRTVQDQLRARLGYEAGNGWTADALFAFWETDGDQTDTGSYLRDAAGQPVFEGPVLLDGRAWTASGVTLQQTDRREMMAGLKLAGDAAGWDLRANLSRYWIGRQHTRASAGYRAGIAGGAGTLARQGDTGWWAGDLLAEREVGELELALGANLYRYETAQTIYATGRWRDAGDPVFSSHTGGRTEQAGAFVDARLPAGDSLVLTGGARIDRWRAHDGRIGRATAAGPRFQSYPARRDTAVSPTLGAEVELAPDWLAQLSLATATRFPTVGELFQGRLDGNGRFDPNSFDPGLKPERSRDANLLVRHTAGGVKLTGSVFYQRVEDAIFSQQGFNRFGVVTSSFKNIDRVRQWGLEGIVEAADVLPGLDLDVNLAWTDAETVRNRPNPAAEGVQFPRIPRWRANANARWRFAEGWQLSLGARYASRPNSDLEGRQRGDAFGYTSELLILDAKLRWDVTDQAHVSVGIDNLANDKAWVFHPYPQRTFVLELGWRL